MVSFPNEWRNYLIPWKNRIFRKDTPADIIKQAKEINEDYENHFGKKFFHFEADEENN